MSDRKWVSVEVVSDYFLGEIIKSLLEAQGVMVNLVREGYEAAYGLQVGVDVDIHVPSDQVELAKQVLADFHAGKYDED